MKIKINKSPYYNILAFIMFMDAGYFILLNIPFFKNNANTRLIILITGAVLAANCFLNKKIRVMVKPYCNYINLFMLYLFLFYLLEFFSTLANYNMQIKSIVSASSYLGVFLLLYPVIYVFICNNGYDKVLRLLRLLVVVHLFIRSCRSLLFNFTGHDAMPFLDTALRSGRLRQGLVSAGGLVFIYCLSKLMKTEVAKKEKLICFCTVLFMVFYELYVNMTRMYILSMFIAAVVMILFKKRPKNKQILVFAIVIIAGIALYFTGTIDSFLQTFSADNAETGSSTLARQASDQYFRTLANQNKLFGIGFLSPVGEYYNLYFGPQGTFFLDDLGIKNMYYHYGILGIILVLSTFGRMLFITIKLGISKKYSEKVFLIGVLTYMTISAISLCIFDAQRIFGLIMYWAIFEYDYHKYFFEHKEDKKQRTRIN